MHDLNGPPAPLPICPTHVMAGDTRRQLRLPDGIRVDFAKCSLKIGIRVDFAKCSLKIAIGVRVDFAECSLVE